MHRRAIIKHIRAAQDRIAQELRTNGSGLFGRGLSNEGYAGGYSQALSDVLLLLQSDCMPNTRNYWPKDDRRATHEAEALSDKGGSE